MLPALSELAGLTIMALLFAAGNHLARARQSKRRPTLHRSGIGTAANILTPLFALGVLALPYLPWVADWIPALRLLAGPGRVLVWVIVIGQVAWLFLPEFTKRLGVKSAVGPFGRFGSRSSLLSLGVYAWSSSRVGRRAGI